MTNVSKFPKCEEYGLKGFYDTEKEVVEQALTKAENRGAKAERERLFKALAEFMSFGRCFKDDKRFWRYNEETIKWIAVMRGIANKKIRGD